MSQAFSEIIGYGRYGAIFKVRDWDNMPIARKLVPRLESNSNTNQPGLLEYRILRLAQFVKFPNVVQSRGQTFQILETLTIPNSHDNIMAEEPPNDPGLNSLVLEMECATMGNLLEFLQRNPKVIINYPLVQLIGRDCCTGLYWLHLYNILHADLKPENLFVFGSLEHPIIKIGDMGSAAIITRCENPITYCRTSYNYAAPEMLMVGLPGERQVSLKADIYSLGIILMEISSHHHPFYPFPRSGEDEKHAEKMTKILMSRPSTPRPILPRFAFPLAFVEVLQGCLEPNPTFRLRPIDLLCDSLLGSMNADFHVDLYVDPTELVCQPTPTLPSTIQVYPFTLDLIVHSDH